MVLPLTVRAMLTVEHHWGFPSLDPGPLEVFLSAKLFLWGVKAAGVYVFFCFLCIAVGSRDI